MGFRYGSGYFGTDSVKTSTVNDDIISNSPSELYKFSFYNQQDCTVTINSKHTLFLQAHQGFEVSEVDAPITSFVVSESGIQYNFVGAY